MARLVGYRIPGGDVVTLVCNAECERKLYSAARFVNFFVNLDATAAHSDAVLRHDLWLEHGGVRVRKGKIEYVDLGDKLLPPE